MKVKQSTKLLVIIMIVPTRVKLNISFILQKKKKKKKKNLTKKNLELN